MECKKQPVQQNISALKKHYSEIKDVHLKEMLANKARIKSFITEDTGVILDFTR